MVQVNDDLFEDDEEMLEIAQNYVSAKYKGCDEDGCRMFCDKTEARDILRSLLPPVSTSELDEEVEKTMALIMQNPENSDDAIDESDFVRAITQNTYWRRAGSLVVKELIYFDALYSYYRTGFALLVDDDYESLKDNLTWEGSAVATMKAKEAMFVTAVASARRGLPIMDDAEYNALKGELKKDGSWVTDRAPDALEKLGMDTFMGYLHRALS
jgi:hypothetical protein